MDIDDYSVSGIQNCLRTRLLGRTLRWFPVVGSTNEVAADLCARGAADGTVVVADEQTAGKGRAGRSWLCGRGGGVLASIILRPEIPAIRVPYLLMALSVGAADAIREVAGVGAHIKWPNDIMIGARKVAGILGEARLQGYVVQTAVLGIGINVGFSPAEVPELSDSATSLERERRCSVSRTALLCRLLEHAESRYQSLKDGDWESVYSAWRDRMGMLGRSVKVHASDGVIEGVAACVDRDGSLLLQIGDGTGVRLTVGDVVVPVDDATVVAVQT
jgi:BirA family transcriptional regulator, biotin operon repressor / biotin---[acetyl-CoA-carboxylase] ligase